MRYLGYFFVSLFFVIGLLIENYPEDFKTPEFIGSATGLFLLGMYFLIKTKKVKDEFN